MVILAQGYRAYVSSVQGEMRRAHRDGCMVCISEDTDVSPKIRGKARSRRLGDRAREQCVTPSLLAAAQKGHPARPQGVGRLRRTREGTSQGAARLRTLLGAFFSRRYGSTVTSTYAGTLSAPFLSVTRSLKRKVRVSETYGAVNDGSAMFTSSMATLLPRTCPQA